jgi:16S rRNA (uracil1498-N3)-methyltransferase
MTRKCFFVDEVNSGEEYATLNREATRHAESVLRLKAGDSIELRDGRGNGWMAVIAGTERQLLRVRLAQRRQIENESPLELTLAMAFARSDRMELVCRQATEIGIKRFVAFRAKRSQYGLSEQQARKRVERWSKIAREALCQCGRGRLPEMGVFADVGELISASSSWRKTGNEGLKVLACEGGWKQSILELKRRVPVCGHMVAVVGAEGGWTDEEIEQFGSGGYHAVHLGPRVLRLETAAVALLSSVQLLWGDFGGISITGGERNEMS